jgi:hypothetical protein
MEFVHQLYYIKITNLKDNSESIVNKITNDLLFNQDCLNIFNELKLIDTNLNYTLTDKICKIFIKDTITKKGWVYNSTENTQKYIYILSLINVNKILYKEPVIKDTYTQTYTQTYTEKQQEKQSQKIQCLKILNEKFYLKETSDKGDELEDKYSESCSKDDKYTESCSEDEDEYKTDLDYNYNYDLDKLLLWCNEEFNESQNKTYKTYNTSDCKEKKLYQDSQKQKYDNDFEYYECSQQQASLDYNYQQNLSQQQPSLDYNYNYQQNLSQQQQASLDYNYQQNLSQQQPSLDYNYQIPYYNDKIQSQYQSQESNWGEPFNYDKNFVWGNCESNKSDKDLISESKNPDKDLISELKLKLNKPNYGLIKQDYCTSYHK